MFSSGDRRKPSVYHAKKNQSSSTPPHDSSNLSTKNPPPPQPRQQVSTSGFGAGKSDDSRKRPPPPTTTVNVSATAKVHQNGQSIGGLLALMKSANKKTKKKQKKKKRQSEQTPLAVKSTSKKEGKKKKQNNSKTGDDDEEQQKQNPGAKVVSPLTASSSTKKRARDNRQKISQFEKSLMHDVRSIVADFESKGGQIEDDDEYIDDYAEEEDEEEVMLKSERKNNNKKQKTKETENDSSESARRSRELGQRARQTLAASMFRSLNEFLYSHDSNQTRREFTANKFKLYHQAYEKLMQDWPLRPIEYLIGVLKKRVPDPKRQAQLVIADIGCGSRARVAEAFPSSTVHSYDLHNGSEDGAGDLRIISADMTRLPLDSEQCDFAVYSLSMMPTNLKECVREANRILKMGGYMLIVEVASRFADYKVASGRQLSQERHVGHGFALDLKSYGFQLTEHEELKPNAFFVYLCFKKTGNVEQMAPKSKLPPLTLKACVYKAR